MVTKKYTVKEIRNLIKEEVNEFKPKLGDNVSSQNKKNNQTAYQDMNKIVKNYDGRLSNKKHEVPVDDNRGMSDLEYDNINDEYKDRVKAQMDGYTSSLAQKNHKKDEFGNAEFNHISGLDKKSKTFKKMKDKAKEIGLTSREIDKKDFAKQSHTVYENVQKPFRLVFKNTSFLSEEHLISKIPDELKVEGKKFYVKDKTNNEYLIEWGEKPQIMNLTKLNEEQERIKALFNYKSLPSNTSYNGCLTEEKKINDMLDKTRKLMK